MELCERIDDETIELQAMGRLRGSPISRHLEVCHFCLGRVAEQRILIEHLKQALRHFLDSEQVSESPGPGHPPRQDAS
jgi:hypothetical protein